jgi:Concanavalin A-like lectin/glucanases superfamily
VRHRARAARLVAAIAALPVLVAVVPRSAADTVLPWQLNAWWHMEELPGATTMPDASGNGNDGVLSSVTLGLPGVVGMAYGFNGTSSIVTVPSSDTLNPGAHDVYLSIWLQLPIGLPEGDYNVLQKGVSVTPGGFYKIELTGENSVGNPVCVFHGSRGEARVVAPNTIADGLWHRVSCVKTANDVSVYIDDVPVASTDVHVGSIANDEPLTIGAKPTHDDWFLGHADGAAIFVR